MSTDPNPNYSLVPEFTHAYQDRSYQVRGNGSRVDRQVPAELALYHVFDRVVPLRLLYDSGVKKSATDVLSAAFSSIESSSSRMDTAVAERVIGKAVLVMQDRLV
jgi:hypothetical protein